MQMQIRRANVEDAESLAGLAWKSFYEAFADHPKNAPDDLKSYMDEAFAVETIRNELADRDVVYFVAESNGRMIGYAKLKQNSREDCTSGENPIELARLYSLQEFIGRGIGRTLMTHCLEFSRQNGHDRMWLGVWEFNFRAQAFYEKYGFERVGEHVFQLGTDPQTDWILERAL